MRTKKTELFDDLQENYSYGLLTDAEFSSKTLELLGGGDKILWEYLPKDIKNTLSAKISNFSESDEIVSFGEKGVDDVKKQMKSLKEWLLEI